MNEFREIGSKQASNGNHVNMISLKEICLFMVIIFGCSAYVNSKNVKNLSPKELANEVNPNANANANSNKIRKTRITSDNENYDDGYVMEDMNQVQQDQPLYMRQPFFYGQMQKEPSAQEKFEQKRRIDKAQSPNLQLTKELLIKQGRLKGFVRTMHPQTGLKSVRQYLGIPYAAAPIGNGRFMPPGLFISFLFDDFSISNNFSNELGHIFRANSKTN